MAKDKDKALTLQQKIDLAKDDFKDQVMVAFLGDKYSGKTVHCALIKDAAVKHLREHTNGKYRGISTDGSERMNKIIDKLYSGEFPAKTYLEEATPMTVEIFSKSAAETIKIVLRDMAGEKKEDLLEREMPIDDRMEEIFKLAPIEGKPYGMMAHLVFAKIYVILIDCSKYPEWPNKQAYVKDTIRHLFDIKQRIGDIANNRIHAPIAIVFSKYDTMDKEKKKTVKELMKELEEIDGALEKYHKGPIKYFKSYVCSHPVPEKELKEAVKKKIEDNVEQKEAENTVNDKTAVRTEAKNRLNKTKHNFNEAMKKLEEVKPANNQPVIDEAQKELDKVQTELNAAEENHTKATSEEDDARKKLNEIKEKLAKQPQPSPEDLGISNYRPKQPLSYSRDDYLDLITWLIKMNKQIRGY